MLLSEISTKEGVLSNSLTKVCYKDPYYKTLQTSCQKFLLEKFIIGCSEQVYQRSLLQIYSNQHYYKCVLNNLIGEAYHRLFQDNIFKQDIRDLSGKFL